MCVFKTVLDEAELVDTGWHRLESFGKRVAQLLIKGVFLQVKPAFSDLEQDR